MKKLTIIFLIIILIMCISFLSACESRKECIDELNATFNGGLKFAEKAPSDPRKIDGFIYEPGFGCYSLNSEDGQTSYTISGYPDSSGDDHITYFTTKNDKYEVFGFSVGDSIESAIDILSEKGYQVEKEFVHGKVMKKSIITISVFSGIGGIDNIGSIFIRLKTTNKQGITY